MPIQVNELVIRAVLTEDGAAGPGPGAPPFDREELISQCVEQVLEILREKGER